MDILTKLYRNSLRAEELTESDFEAIDKKRKNPNSKVMCPRCKSLELKYDGGEHGNSVYCEKMGCIFSGLHGI